MIKIYQDKFGKPHGNCFGACVASLLEITLGEVPDLSDEKTWWTKIREFIRTHGYDLVSMNPQKGMVYDPYLFPYGYAIGCGTSSRGFEHACVFKDGELVHDPFPGGDGIEMPVKEWIYFVEMDPVRGKTF